MSVREDYSLPEKPPVPARMWALMVAVPVVALLLWTLLPSGPVTVVVIALVLLGGIGFTLSRILASRAINEKPGRNPVRPPSAS